MTDRIMTLNSHRFKNNPLEQNFYNEWIKRNDYGEILEYILCNSKDNVSERDEIVAATVIQWLGSPVGQDFIESVMNGEVT